MPATYEPISTQTLGTATAAISFTSIPQTYTDLFLVTNIGMATVDNSALITFNDDTGSNYSLTWLYENGTPGSSRSTSRANIYMNANVGASTSVETMTTTSIQNYSNTTTYKTIIGRANRASSSGSYEGTEALVGLWRSTSAITKITITGQSNLIVGCTFTLYGIKAA